MLVITSTPGDVEFRPSCSIDSWDGEDAEEDNGGVWGVGVSRDVVVVGTLTPRDCVRPRGWEKSGGVLVFGETDGRSDTLRPSVGVDGEAG